MFGAWGRTKQILVNAIVYIVNSGVLTPKNTFKES